MSASKNEGHFKYMFSHLFKNPFTDVALAFWKKYRENNGYSMITLVNVYQNNDHSFTFVRRMDNAMSSEPTFEKITYDSLKPSIVADLFDKNTKNPSLAERCVYLMNKLYGTDYMLQVYKEQLNSLIRRKVFYWGVQTMESLMVSCQSKKNNE